MSLLELKFKVMLEVGDRVFCNVLNVLLTETTLEIYGTIPNIHYSDKLYFITKIYHNLRCCELSYKKIMLKNE